MKKGKNYDRDTKMFKSFRNGTVKCRCGHSIVMNNVDKVLCSYCGHYVYNERKEFKSKMRELLMKGEKNEEKSEEQTIY
jgi:hypothetical protein